MLNSNSVNLNSQLFRCTATQYEIKRMMLCIYFKWDLKKYIQQKLLNMFDFSLSFSQATTLWLQANQSQLSQGPLPTPYPLTKQDPS